MYIVDEKDRVVPIKDFPQSCAGAPCPVILSNEFVAVVAFLLQEILHNFANTEAKGEPIALVRFSHCYASMFGPPNDEAFHGHPLASRGLIPYGAFVIENSSWIRQLEQMNAVHPYHNPEKFQARKHYVLSFHDSTFECVADGYSVESHDSFINDILPRMAELLHQSSNQIGSKT